MVCHSVIECGVDKMLQNYDVARCGVAVRLETNDLIGTGSGGIEVEAVVAGTSAVEGVADAETIECVVAA